MSPSALLATARSNTLRLLLTAAAAVALSAGSAAAPAEAKPAAAKADGQRSERVVATASAAKRRSGARSVRKVRGHGRGVHGRATGRKVG